jgi:aminoglycoside phosphotransferase (APT) family kinase protein
LTDVDRTVLRSLVLSCDLVEDRWSEVEGFCAHLPPTLVHGDFVPKNIRIRHNGADPELLVFDWEGSGWGVPAADLADLLAPSAEDVAELYRASLNAASDLVSTRDVEKMGQVGRLFRCLAGLDWACAILTDEDLTYTMPKYMYVYEHQLSDAIRAFTWLV